MRITIFILAIFILTSCGIDCVDKKTGLHKSSQTLKDSKKNGVFNFEIFSETTSLLLDSGLIFKVNNAWVENSWSYECINNEVIVQKGSILQFVIDASYEGDALNHDYWLMNKPLGSVLDYGYSGEDTIRLTLRNSQSIVDTLTFVKQVSR